MCSAKRKQAVAAGYRPDLKARSSVWYTELTLSVMSLLKNDSAAECVIAYHHVNVAASEVHAAQAQTPAQAS